MCKCACWFETSSTFLISSLLTFPLKLKWSLINFRNLLNIILIVFGLSAFNNLTILHWFRIWIWWIVRNCHQWLLIWTFNWQLLFSWLMGSCSSSFDILTELIYKVDDTLNLRTSSNKMAVIKLWVWTYLYYLL